MWEILEQSLQNIRRSNRKNSKMFEQLKFDNMSGEKDFKPHIVWCSVILKPNNNCIDAIKSFFGCCMKFEWHFMPTRRHNLFSVACINWFLKQFKNNLTTNMILLYFQLGPFSMKAVYTSENVMQNKLST